MNGGCCVRSLASVSLCSANNFTGNSDSGLHANNDQDQGEHEQVLTLIVKIGLRVAVGVSTKVRARVKMGDGQIKPRIEVSTSSSFVDSNRARKNHFLSVMSDLKRESTRRTSNLIGDNFI
jgi:hypothetical protein